MKNSCIKCNKALDLLNIYISHVNNNDYVCNDCSYIRDKISLFRKKSGLPKKIGFMTWKQLSEHKKNKKELEQKAQLIDITKKII